MCELHIIHSECIHSLCMHVCCIVGKAKAFMGISLFVGIPMVFLSAYNAYKLESEHHHHIEEHGRPPFVAYPHLRRRSKVVTSVSSILYHVIVPYAPCTIV